VIAIRELKLLCGNWFSIYSNGELDLSPEKQSQASALVKEALYDVWVCNCLPLGNSTYCSETDFLFSSNSKLDLRTFDLKSNPKQAHCLCMVKEACMKFEFDCPYIRELKLLCGNEIKTDGQIALQYPLQSLMQMDKKKTFFQVYSILKCRLMWSIFNSWQTRNYDAWVFLGEILWELWPGHYFDQILCDLIMQQTPDLHVIYTCIMKQQPSVFLFVLSI